MERIFGSPSTQSSAADPMVWVQGSVIMEHLLMEHLEHLMSKVFHDDATLDPYIG